MLLHNFVYPFPDLPPEFTGAVLPMDKAQGWTSFDVVKKLRGIVKVRKIGHAGTLDPMATGLLICLVGRKATRRMNEFMEMRKEYEGTIRLGESTPSYDAETEVIRRIPTDHLHLDDILSAVEAFRGEIEQVPPMYSALKVGGERLYKKARRGETIELKKRAVKIYNFDIVSYDKNGLHFIIGCSKGTYIRSIAHDLGEALQVGGHLSRLRRTSIGSIHVKDAWSIESLQNALSSR